MVPQEWGSIALLVAVLCLIWQAPQLLRSARAHYWQKQCLVYQPTKDLVVYEESPDQAKQLRAANADYRIAPLHWPNQSSVYYRNPSFAALCDAEHGRALDTAPILFMHHLRSPKGNDRLVAVQFSATDIGMGLSPMVIHADSPFKRGLSAVVRNLGPTNRGMIIKRASTDQIRLFAGTTDPNDPSHFTFDYEVNGQHGRADGYLKDDETVSLWPRTGIPLRGYGGNVWWNPTGAPMPDWPPPPESLATQPTE